MKQSNLSLPKIFKALSNEQRLSLFLMIYKGCGGEGKSGAKKSSKECEKKMEKAFSKACGCMNLCRSTISHHFNELQDAGLIKATRKGQSYLCEVNEEAVNLVRNFLKL